MVEDISRTCPHCGVYVLFRHLRQTLYRCPRCKKDIRYSPNTRGVVKVIKHKGKTTLIPVPPESLPPPRKLRGSKMMGGREHGKG